MGIYINSNGSLGAKAENLFKLKKAGFNVPPFFCADSSSTEKEISGAIKALALSGISGELFSVRSSADCEDGAENSFAGQFKTYLYVPKQDVFSRVRDCLSHRAEEYAKAAEISACGKINCIVQQMIDPQISGVIFTSNPNGRLNETVVTAGYGVGENVVSGKGAVVQLYINRSDGSRWYETQNGAPNVNEIPADGLLDISERISKLFGFSCDIEFAVCNGEIYILQARRITALKVRRKIILDASNICESYPGVSLPLTQDFVSKAYYGVFRSVVKRLTRSEKVTKHLDKTLRKMTDTADGRIYYRISGWYDVIKLLPFSDKIIPLWQDMLGVEDTTVTSDFNADIFTKITVTVQFFDLLFTNNRRMKELDRYFKDRIKVFRKRVRQTSGAENLLALYEEISSEICAVWDITLVNDMYTFIYTGLLETALKLRCPTEYKKRLADCIYNSGRLESMKPVRALEKLRKYADTSGLVPALENVSSEEDWRSFLALCPEDFRRMLDRYTELYGDRAPCELKLESQTPRTNPELLAKMICGAVPDKTKTASRTGKLNYLEKFLSEKVRQGVAQRERSRLDRARLYGIMRGIIHKAADELYESGRLKRPQDIFYLSTEEIKALSEGRDFSREIARRKSLYEMYNLMPSPKRIVFANKVFDVNPSSVNKVSAKCGKGVFRGIACSGGIVTAEVVKVGSPAETSAEKVRGKIIAARMTDPGWVTLISECAGLICERGSLLSHTAIISRELKKPAVVGIQNVFDKLSDGQRVNLNGSTGEVIILNGVQK